MRTMINRQRACEALSKSMIRTLDTTKESILESMRMITAARIALWTGLLLVPLSLSAQQAQNPAPADAKTVPVIDGGIGPCSAQFTVTDSAQAPVYAANIKVHIAYGFMYLRKLDLQIGTNADGKARFTGFPDRVKHGLFFEASEGDRTAEAFDDPSTNCKNQFTVVLRKKP